MRIICHRRSAAAAPTSAAVSPNRATQQSSRIPAIRRTRTDANLRHICCTGQRRSARKFKHHLAKGVSR